MKKSAKLSLALALMMGTTAGVQVMTNNASAEVSDKFRMELNGVSSYFHDTDKVYYGQTRTDNTGLGKGWNNYTRVQLTYNVDKDVQAVARLHSNYDNAGDFAANKNTSGAYFDQSYIKYNDRKNNLHYIVGKKGMTLGQSMVYNSTGNLTGVQVSYGNFWDPTCFQLSSHLLFLQPLINKISQNQIATGKYHAKSSKEGIINYQQHKIQHSYQEIQGNLGKGACDKGSDFLP